MDFAQKTNAEINQERTVTGVPSEKHGKEHDKEHGDDRQSTYCSGPPVPVEQAGKIAVCTLLSRLLGLARDIMIIMALGLGADIFFMAFRLPNIMRRMTAEGVLGMGHAAKLGRAGTDIPETAPQISHERLLAASPDISSVVSAGSTRSSPYPSPDDARSGKNGLAYSLKTALLYGGITAIVACLLWIFAPACMKLVAPGFDKGRLQEAVYLFRWCLLYLPLASATAVLAATLIHYGLAGYAALAPLLLNVGIITLGAGAFATENASFFAMGVVAGGGLQLAWVAFWVCRLLALKQGKLGVLQDMRSILRWCLEFFEKTAQKGKKGVSHKLSALAQVFMMVAIGSSAYLYFFMSSVGASFFAEGAVSALYIGERFMEFPLAIIASSIGMAFMPQFSRLAHDRRALQEALGRTLRLACLVCLPAAVGIVMLHKPIIFLFFGYGAMDASEALITARMFAVLGVALPAFCLNRQFMGALIALSGAEAAPVMLGHDAIKDNLKGEDEGGKQELLQKMGHTVWLGCFAILAVSALLGRFLGLCAVALGVVVAAWGQCLYLWRLAQREIAFERPFDFARRHRCYLLALLFLALGLWLVGVPLENMTNRWLSGAVLCLVILGVSFGWIKVFAFGGNEEARALWETLTKLWRGKMCRNP